MDGERCNMMQDGVQVENESKMTVKEDKEEMDNKKKKQVTIR